MPTNKTFTPDPITPTDSHNQVAADLATQFAQIDTDLTSYGVIIDANEAKADGRPREFADDTTVNPADPGNPTEAEMTVFTTAGSIIDALVYYTGTDTGTDPVTALFLVDSNGAVTSMGAAGGASFYDEDGALDADRTVTMAGFDLTLDGAQNTVLRDVGVHDAVAWRKASGGGLFGAGTVAPDLGEASDFNWGIASTDAGDLNVGNPVAPLTGFATEYILSFANTDTVPRNVVFAAHYMDRAGTQLGTQIVQPNSWLHFHFTYQSGLFAGSYLDDVLPSASDVTATVINSSGGVVTETLPAAVGGGAVLFYSTEDVTNTATLTPASGEQLNGVVDATFLFSNYSAGTQFRADDIGPSQWVVSVVGATSTSDPVKSAALTELTSTSHTLVTGTAPASTQVAINSINYIDEGSSFRRVYLDFYSFQDNQVVLELGTGLVPATAEIRAAFATHAAGSSVENSANHRPSLYVSASNQITVNRDDTAQGGVTAIGIGLLVEDSAGSFAGSELVLAGMVTPSTLGTAHVYRDTGYTVPSTASNFPTTVGTAQRMQFTAADGTASGTSVTIGTNEVAVTADGEYEITARATTDPFNNGSAVGMGLFINGTLIEYDQRVHSGTGDNDLTTQVINSIQTLVAGDVIDIRFSEGNTGQVIGIGAGHSLTVKQLPTSTVVLPEALTPRTTAFATYTLTADGDPGGGTPPLGPVPNWQRVGDFNVDGITERTAAGITGWTLTAGRRYKLTAQLRLTAALSSATQYSWYDELASAAVGGEAYLHSVNNGSTGGATDLAVAIVTPAVDTTYSIWQLTGAGGDDIATSGSWVTIEEMPDKSVITPGSVDVTDWTTYPVEFKAVTTDPTLATGHTLIGKYRKLGNNLSVKVRYRHGQAGGSGVGQYYFTLPAGFTPDPDFVSIDEVEGDLHNVIRVGDVTASDAAASGEGPASVRAAGLFMYADDDGGAKQPIDDNWYDLNTVTMGLSVTAEIPLI